MLRSVLILVALLGPSHATAQNELTVGTVYVDKTDTFVTKGTVQLSHPVDRVARVAADLHAYHRWVLEKINVRQDGKPYIIKLNSVIYRPGLPHGLGHFVVGYDIDLVWPFGRENQEIKFAVVHKPPHPAGGISALVLNLWGDNRAIKTFSLSLYGRGTHTVSHIDFIANVQLTGWIDVFFPLSVYRKNIEQRVVKVIVNLRAYLAQGHGPKP